MPIAILECAVDSITFTSFFIKNDSISIDHQIKKNFKCALNDWISFAGLAIQELVHQFNISFPIIILLPEFALLTKSFKVPKVAPNKQTSIIYSHISQLLGASNKECLGFAIKSYNDIEIEAIASIVKSDWIQSFCNYIESIGIKVESIQAPITHYYNAFNLLLNSYSDNILLLVFSETIVSCLFINRKSITVFKLQSETNDFNASLKELLLFNNSKYTENIPELVLVSGLKETNRSLLTSLSTDLALPIKTFAPLVDDHLCPLGSTGLIYAKLLGKGLFADLTPLSVRKRWIFKRSQKALIFTASAIIVASSVFLITLNRQQSHYDSLIHDYQNKITPLKVTASTIQRNEQVIQSFEAGLAALQAQVQSSHSWVSFLNSLQSILIKFPSVHINGLNINHLESQDSWQTLMSLESNPKKSNDLRLLNLEGVVQVDNPNTLPNEIIEDIRCFITHLTQLHFIEDTKNLSFDLQSFPSVPFSVSLLLKPGVL